MEMAHNFVFAVALAEVLLGLLSCFSGYQLFRFLLGAVGFLTGIFLATSVAFAITDQNLVLTLFLGLLGGLIGAALLLSFYFLGVFVVGGILGALLSQLLSTQIAMEPVILTLILVVGCGILALALQKILIIISTALAGAWMALSGAGYFLFGLNPLSFLDWPLPVLASPGRYWPLLVGWVVLSLAGVAVQQSSSRRRKEMNRHREESD